MVDSTAGSGARFFPASFDSASPLHSHPQLDGRPVAARVQLSPPLAAPCLRQAHRHSLDDPDGDVFADLHWEADVCTDPLWDCGDASTNASDTHSQGSAPCVGPTSCAARRRRRGNARLAFRVRPRRPRRGRRKNPASRASRRDRVSPPAPGGHGALRRWNLDSFWVGGPSPPPRRGVFSGPSAWRPDARADPGVSDPYVQSCEPARPQVVLGPPLWSRFEAHFGLLHPDAVPVPRVRQPAGVALPSPDEVNGPFFCRRVLPWCA